MNGKIEVPFSRSKLLLAICGSMLFVIFSIYLLAKADGNEGSAILIKGIAVAGILFFGTTGIFGLMKLSGPKVGLTIDPTGITDYSNATSIGLIEWKDILDIKTKQFMTSKFLLITVNNPEKYIGKAKNGVIARLMSMNMNMYGTPLSISSNTLKYDFEELERLLQSELKKYRAR